MNGTRERYLATPPGIKGVPDGSGKASVEYCKYKQPIEQQILPKSDKLVVTIGVGKSRDLLRLSAPYMKAYATRIGADFLAITNGTQSWPMAEKFRLKEIVCFYSRALFLDADVFVRPCAPDIFNVVPQGSIGTHNDMYYLDHGDGMFRDSAWIEIEQKALGISQGITLQRACLNSGVTVCDGTDAKIWDAPADRFPVAHTMEQNWVQHNILKTGRAFFLPSEWNYQWWMDPQLEHIEDAYFVHLAGLGHFFKDMMVPMMRALCLR